MLKYPKLYKNCKNWQNIIKQKYLNSYILHNSFKILASDKENDNSNSLDVLMLAIPTQDIEIESTGDTGGKRKSPVLEGGAKRRSIVNRLDIYKAWFNFNIYYKKFVETVYYI